MFVLNVFYFFLLELRRTGADLLIG